MSKLGCTCGHVIRDQTDDLPYKGEVLKAQDWYAFFAHTAEAFLNYLSAVRGGDLEPWLEAWPWLRGATDERVVWALLGWFWQRCKVDVFECEECGRLWVQERTDSQRFIPFAPDEPHAGRVLPSEHARAGQSSAGEPAEPVAAPDPAPKAGPGR